METKSMELYGVVTKVESLHARGILLNVTEDKTGTEWEVIIDDKRVDCELEEGLHVYVKGVKAVIAKNGIFADYVGEWGRICSHCGKHHEEGYYSENTGLYACSDECLNALYTKEEIEEEREHEWLFWTEWYN